MAGKLKVNQLSTADVQYSGVVRIRTCSPWITKTDAEPFNYPSPLLIYLNLYQIDFEIQNGICESFSSLLDFPENLFHSTRVQKSLYKDKNGLKTGHITENLALVFLITFVEGRIQMR